MGKATTLQISADAAIKLAAIALSIGERKDMTLAFSKAGKEITSQPTPKNVAFE